MEFLNWDGVGHHIARVRKLRRWTQKELADKLNVHTSMITRWEKGQIQPKESQVAQIARALDVKQDEFFSPRADLSPMSSSSDPELAVLLGQIASLDEGDRQALKAVIQAMVVKSRVREAMGSAQLTKQAV